MSQGMSFVRITLLGVLVGALTTVPPAAHGGIVIPLGEASVGMPPLDFDFGVTGPGQPGRWTIVRDTTVPTGMALEQVSDDPTEDRFDFALHHALALKNFMASTRFALLSGTMQSAGIVFRFIDAKNYYVLRASAIERRVDLYHMCDGAMKRLAGRETEVAVNRWHRLTLIANDGQFDVALDGKPLFIVWDRAILRDGRVGLWTQEDNVTRFDQFDIAPLLSSEEP
jgi:hypothetical protein